MFASRSLFLVLALCFTALFAPILAAPTPAPEPAVEDESTSLDKRINHSGQGTWFQPGLGACGKYNKATDLILAISAHRWNGGTNCGQYVQIINTKNGKSAYGKVVDECPGCSDGSIDLSPSLFKKLGTLDQGVVPVTCSWPWAGRLEHLDMHRFTPQPALWQLLRCHLSRVSPPSPS